MALSTDLTKAQLQQPMFKDVDIQRIKNPKLKT